MRTSVEDEGHVYPVSGPPLNPFRRRHPRPLLPEEALNRAADRLCEARHYVAVLPPEDDASEDRLVALQPADGHQCPYQATAEFTGAELRANDPVQHVLRTLYRDTLDT